MQIYQRLFSVSMTNYSGILLRVAVLFSMLFVAGLCESTKNLQQKRLKLLYYTSSDDGSHHLTNTKIAAALVRRGHDVTFLLSNSYTKWRNASDASMFKFIVHQSRYTTEDRARNIRELSRLGFRGDLRGMWIATKFVMRQKYFTSSQSPTGVLFDFFLNECDSLLGDKETIRQLREERFDMLIGEALSDCQPLLAEVLGLKFVIISGFGIDPAKGSW